MTTFLTAPLRPAILALASGVGGDGSSSPIPAAIVLPLLGLTALTVARGGRRTTRVGISEFEDGEGRDDRDDELPQRFMYVPPAKGVHDLLDPEVETIAGLEAGQKLDDRDLAQLLGRPEPQPTAPDEQGLEELLAEWIAGPLEQAAASFAPIQLAVLNRRAKLATRIDRKYILDARTFERLADELIPHYLILEIDGARDFPYDTVYFDTPTWTTYRQHIQGRRRRFKCRTRFYAANGLCFFEVKMKGVRGKTVKRQLEVDPEEHGVLTSSAFAFLERELDRAYRAAPPPALAPSLRTSYRRLTLAGQADSERLTFDFDLMFSANGRNHSIQPGRILLETKSEARTAGANRVLQRLGVRPLGSCSKYCLGVALANPDMHHNPFGRLMREHFEAERLPPARA